MVCHILCIAIKMVPKDCCNIIFFKQGGFPLGPLPISAPHLPLVDNPHTGATEEMFGKPDWLIDFVDIKGRRNGLLS